MLLTLLSWHLKFSLFIFFLILFVELYYKNNLRENAKYIDVEEKVFYSSGLPLRLYALAIVSIVPILNIQSAFTVILLSIYDLEDENEGKFLNKVRDIVDGLD